MFVLWKSHIVCPLRPLLSTKMPLLRLQWQHGATPTGSGEGIQAQLCHFITLECIKRPQKKT